MAVKFWSDKRSQVEAWSAVSPMQVVDSCLVCFMQSGSLVSSVFAKKCLHRLISLFYLTQQFVMTGGAHSSPEQAPQSFFLISCRSFISFSLAFC